VPNLQLIACQLSWLFLCPLSQLSTVRHTELAFCSMAMTMSLVQNIISEGKEGTGWGTDENICQARLAVEDTGRRTSLTNLLVAVCIKLSAISKWRFSLLQTPTRQDLMSDILPARYHLASFIVLVQEEIRSSYIEHHEMVGVPGSMKLMNREITHKDWLLGQYFKP